MTRITDAYANIMADALMNLAADARTAERKAVVEWLDFMKVEASGLGQADAVVWIAQIKRNIERGDHLT